jgi:hypothetical protein
MRYVPIVQSTPSVLKAFFSISNCRAVPKDKGITGSQKVDLALEHAHPPLLKTKRFLTWASP